jgi:hypothetical protein
MDCLLEFIMLDHIIRPRDHKVPTPSIEDVVPPDGIVIPRYHHPISPRSGELTPFHQVIRPTDKEHKRSLPTRP